MYDTENPGSAAAMTQKRVKDMWGGALLVTYSKRQTQRRKNVEK